MKTIQIYDPPMCCSTGICGIDFNPDLVPFSAMLIELAKLGVTVDRYNLGQQPMAFAQNPGVRALLESDGQNALPLIFWDGKLHQKGRYPTQTERTEWLRTARENT